MRRLLLAVFLFSLAGAAHANYAYVQEQTSSQAATGTSLPVSITPTDPGSDVIVAFVSAAGSLTGETVSDGKNTWNKVTSFYNATWGGTIDIWYAVNAASGATTVTWSPGASTTYMSITVVEYTGLSGTPYVSGEYATAFQSAPGAGTDAISSGNTPALSSQPAAIIGFHFNTNLGTAPTVGTGFTSRATITVFGSASILLQDERLTATTAVASTSTAAAGTSGNNFTSVAVIMHEPAAGGSCTHSGWNIATGAFSVPTAGSGSFWLQSGAKGTTDCSATKYWQSGGVFGAN